MFPLSVKAKAGKSNSMALLISDLISAVDCNKVNCEWTCKWVNGASSNSTGNSVVSVRCVLSDCFKALLASFRF